jgi:CRP-like cAMP-binding protein
MPTASPQSSPHLAEPSSSARRNRILAALPADSLDRMAEHLEPVELGMKMRVYEPHGPIEHVYFPLSGVISLLSIADDAGIEIATVGNEGMAGVGAFLGKPVMPWRAIVQIPGQALRIPVAQFQRELDRDGALRAMLGHYTQAMLIHVAQSAACNRLHPVDERCARWLLTSHDRVDSDTFPVTQEFLSQMLGVRRASVTVAAGILQRAGTIRYARGKVRILDRKALEAASCECYHITRREYEQLHVPPERVASAVA